ncbi:diadenylate cyclase CdaA [Acaryochloris sp. 'Moss Beach']|uniref:diadenylate cyclase CdaA n=1 Tax=Acaryochloris TaxID=155977 RepID=UPI001BAE8B67|nr:MULTISPECIES: diadenylate cyclase CdaA [Acaryochloris]QUY40637.1 TIGR00159 family protein [Acaryochloris marina S15]QUY45896.1 TIGR00159 family protein [Acaryochloris marina S15]UJB69841.1 diadenylate cyclase CdaA [Acaryochloris sp. 'Moss Beach']
MDGVKEWLINHDWVQTFRSLIDISLALALTYMLLLVIAERRTLWMVRGVVFLVLATVASKLLQFNYLNQLLTFLLIGSAVAMAVILQSEVRRFLEQLGRGELLKMLRPAQQVTQNPDNIIDEIVDAIKELSQNRTGALLIIETRNIPIDERDFSVPGIKLSAEISREIIQTIFQTTTLLHDGALLIRGDRIISAGVILPISEQTASRQLGTRHRAAMGITERVDNCVCIVVSEETGSISLAEQGILRRPLTSSKLRELLADRLILSVDREVVTPSLRSLGRKIRKQVFSLLSLIFPLLKSRKNI